MSVVVKANTEDLLKSLVKAKEEITRKLTGMVVEFAGDMAAVASDATPIGDEVSMQPVSEGGNSRYRAYYESRQRDFGIPIQPGFHKGAWEYGNPSFKPVINEVAGMINDVVNEAESSYRLGDLVVIGASGPGYADLLPRIEAANVGSIIKAYTANFQGYYDKS